MALLLGALMIQGVNPGPNMIVMFPEVFWGLIASMWLGNMILLVLNLPLVGMWVKLLSVPYRWLYPAILAFSCFGLYTLSFSSFDIYLMVLFGLVGFLFLILRCELVPFIIGVILGPMFEEHFQRAMLLARGDVTVFVSSPLSLVFNLISLGLVVVMVLPAVRRNKDSILEEEA